MFKVKPVFKDYIWGGSKLREEYGKHCELKVIAESWELSTHPAGICQIERSGKVEPITAYLHRQGKSVLGSKCQAEEIPLLIKLIDARDDLSVQVHPDDAYALKHEGERGKTEMWYVLEAEEGARLIYGFKEDLTKEELRSSIKNNALKQYLNNIEVHKGDVFFIPPGMMHAIGRGIVIAEIQESSNVTYRVYDYGRLGADGRTRPLHIEKALEVTNLRKAPSCSSAYEMMRQEGAEAGTLASCQFFTVKRILLKSGLHLIADSQSFHHLLITEGRMAVITKEESLEGQKGDSFFIPAGTGAYELRGKGEVLLTTL